MIWRPFDYFTVSTLLPIPGAPKIILTHAFQDWINGVTHIEMRVAEPKPKDEGFVDQAGSKFKENITKAIGDLRLMLEGPADFHRGNSRAAPNTLERAVPDRASEITRKLKDSPYPQLGRDVVLMVQWRHDPSKEAC